MDHPQTGRHSSGEEKDAHSAAAGTETGGNEVAFSEAGGATVAALLHLLRLTGAELVLMRRDCDPTRFEQAVRAKIEQFPSPTANGPAREAGLAHARHLVEQVLLQIRAQAELKRSLGPQAARGAHAPAPAPSDLTPALSKLLN
jgi:hypothetical protein